METRQLIDVYDKNDFFTVYSDKKKEHGKWYAY